MHSHNTRIAPSASAEGAAPKRNPDLRPLPPKETLALVGRINRACREHRITQSTFGRHVLGDPSFVGDLMRGRSPRPRTVAMVDAYIAKLEEARHG